MPWHKPTQERVKVLQVIVPKAEAKQIEQAAQRDRLPTSRFCRQVIMRHVEQRQDGWR